MKIRIFLTTIFIIAGCALFYHLNTRQNDPMDVVKLIWANMNHATGEINDYAGDINFLGPESVGYEPLDNNKLRIYFGDLQFDIDQEHVANKEFMQALGHIGIEIKQNKKTGKVYVYFHGEEVELFNKRKK